MRRRLRGGLGFAGEADHGLAGRQSDQMLTLDDGFDLLQVGVVDLEQLVVGDAFLLQLAQHIVVVRGLQSPPSSDAHCDRHHLFPGGRVDVQSPVDDFPRLHVDADLFEIVCVDLRRQLVGLAGSRQDRLASPLRNLIELPRQGFEVALPTLQTALLEQLPGALEILGPVLQVLFDLHAPRADQ